MDFWDLTRLLVRRWWIAVPLVVLTAGLSLLTLAAVKPNYTATAYVQLVPPTRITQPGQPVREQRNPWLSLGLQALGNAASVAVLDQSVVEELEARGFSDSYTLTMNSGSPLITFEVVGDTEQQALDTTNALVERFTGSVAQLQKENGADPADTISAARLDNGHNVKESDSRVKRALIAVAGAGLLLTAGITVAVDTWLRRRAQRASEAPFDFPDGPAPEPRRNPAEPMRRPDLSTPRDRAEHAPTSPRQGKQPGQVTYTIPAGTGQSALILDEPAAGQPAEAGPEPALQERVPPAEESADSTVVLPLHFRSGRSGDGKGRA